MIPGGSFAIVTDYSRAALGDRQEDRLEWTTENELDGIHLHGFSGGSTLEELYRDRCRTLPQGPGVYLVLRERGGAPAFLTSSRAGWFKGRDPSYPADLVRDAWVPGAHVMYVGKAAGAQGVRQRVRQLVDFGFGKPVGHRGGRALWHLADHCELTLLWKLCARDFADPLESELIGQFRRHHGARPFANRVK